MRSRAHFGNDVVADVVATAVPRHQAPRHSEMAIAQGGMESHVTISENVVATALCRRSARGLQTARRNATRAASLQPRGLQMTRCVQAILEGIDGLSRRELRITGRRRDI